jgi:hypothetical protein
VLTEQSRRALTCTVCVLFSDFDGRTIAEGHTAATADVPTPGIL